jgi:hypothetical protein
VVLQAKGLNYPIVMSSNWLRSVESFDGESMSSTP